MLNEIDTTKIQTEVRKAMERAGARYLGGHHGPDHTGRFVHDLDFEFAGGRLQVSVKPIETADTAAGDHEDLDKTMDAFDAAFLDTP